MAKYRMERELLDKWVAALEGGKYRQGHNTLYDNGAYCCLGVLCQVAGLPLDTDDGVEGYESGDYEPIAGLFEPSEFSLSGLPEFWQRNDGCTLGLGAVIPVHTFPQIAQYIRDEVEAVDEVTK